jgi:hypothetical protein
VQDATTLFGEVRQLLAEFSGFERLITARIATMGNAEGVGWLFYHFFKQFPC